ncbi:uncharacterized protein LOC110178221 isoform X2 [Drosophila serrata]|uniref:uncharacterized protein LOC110178221 isoform X2 n=1 Tax=Drosophila serrata TaxID=7274 RepID=UPI000A1D29C0|nr:uncharacterized protein LOC110178221 isoform X2 [Drosophila serrata]
MLRGCFASYSTDRPLLKVRQYSWRFPASQDLLRDFYLLQVERRVEGSTYAARCYLKVEMGHVEAVISGGRHRRFSYKDILWMNGSMSYDFSRSPAEKQFSIYLWNCESHDDKDNQFCRDNISSEAAFSIPANTLKKGFTYVFQLQVSRDHNPKISSQIYQNVTIVARRVLHVKIKCLKNCRRDFYTPNSQVHLMGICANCGTVNAVRRWSIDGQRMFSSKEITIHIRAETNSTQIKLSMLAEDGRYGRDIKTLVRNTGPTGGMCSMSPREGQEAITPFVPCCQEFVTENQPIEYWYYVGAVLIESCVDCGCEIRLPATNFLHVLVCDALFLCHSSWIKVKVAPLVGIPTHPTTLQQYLISPPNSILRLLKERQISSYLQVVNAIASRISLPESGITLLNGFRDIQPYTRSSLSKLANLTQTLAHRLPTSNPKTQALLIMVVRKLTDNFQEVISNEDAMDMTQLPLLYITLACQKVYQLMHEIAEKIPRPPSSIYDRYQQALFRGSLDQNLVDKLYSEMSATRTMPWNWINYTFETDRLKSLMKVFRPKMTQFKERGPPPKVAVQVQCLKGLPKGALLVNTTDSLHRVLLTKDLFKEILGDQNPDICFKLVSIQRTLNWWYPDEKRPTSRMLSVRIFRKKEKNTFNNEINLVNSYLKYSVNMTIPSMRAPNDRSLMDNHWRQFGAVARNAPQEIHAGKYIRIIRHGRLKSLQAVRLYRIMLDEQTVMAVHFIKSTHKLQVKLKLEIKPLWREISDSWCGVPALTTNKTLLLRNNCRQPKRAYMALRVWSNIPIRNSPNTPLPGGPAAYTFAFQVRSCASWIYSLPRDEQVWTHSGCVPIMDINVTKELQCACAVLGTYTSYVYYTPPIRVSVGTFTKPRLNKKIIYIYLALIIFLLLVMYWLFRYRNDPPAKTVFIRMADDDDVKDDELHDFLIKFNTGGRVNSLTTASITLVLLTTDQTKRKVRVRQDPDRSFFTRNSTFNVWLRSREIRIPTKLMIYHDNAGRYPSWFLRSIAVNDIQTRETQIFIVRQWITDKVLILQSPHLFRWGDILSLETWCRRFRLHLEMLFINWLLWQPVTGSWRENSHFQSLSRAKRFCVFVSKLILVYTCCAIYFRNTTIESLQLDREMFLSYKEMIALVICVTAADAGFQLIFKLIGKHVS